MNSRERIVTAGMGGVPDRLPVMLYMANHSTAAVGGHLGECYKNGRSLAEAQLKALEVYGQDAVIAQSDNYYMAEAFGCEVDYYQDATPTLKTPALKSLRDVASLKPVDPLSSGRMYVYLDAIRILKEELGDETAIRGCGTGPFVLCGHLMGTEQFLLALAEIHYGEREPGETENPNSEKVAGSDFSGSAAIKEMLEIGRETLQAFVKLQLEAGATVVQCADSTASIDMISPELYETYVFPVEKQFFDTVNPLCDKYNAISLLHICGDNTKILGRMADTGARLIEIDHKVDLGRAKQVIGKKAALIGNLDPTGHLLLGDFGVIEEAVQACIQKAATDGGFILGSGCEVPINAPRENVIHAVKTASAYTYT